MVDILLITDIPRVRKIFSRLADTKTVKVRVANSLEKGGEELAADKPSIVFVQTLLSGLSAEIILMHLKKQLGRKRTRFVLLASKEQAAPYIVNSYHGYVDISGSDENVQAEARELMTALLAKPVKKPAQPVMEDISVIPPHEVEEHIAASLENPEPEHAVIATPLELAEIAPHPATETLPEPMPEPIPEPMSQEPSAVEQGIAYPSRPRLSVYSEFNSSFDSAVNTMEPTEKVGETLQQTEHSWHTIETEHKESSSLSTKRNFLLWLAPVVVVVVVVTFLQQKRTPPEKPKSAANAVKVESAKAGTPAIVVTPAPVAVPPVAPALPKQPSPAPVVTPPPVKPVASVASTRLKQLPDFVPRYGYDKNYGKENPGWERYKGQVTEFKILREGEGIKAIQVLDRGGAGVPESFMKGVLRQLAAKPSLEVTSSEKKEGYEIQRGRVSDSQDIVYYRDADGGRLRGFVVTWR